MPPPAKGVISGPVRLQYPEPRPLWLPGPPRPVPVYECSLHGEFIHFGVGRIECHRCRLDRESYTRQRRNSVRQPPRPPFEKVAGVCSLCGGPLSGRRRSWCSDACVNLWNVATNSAAALHHLRELHGHECWDCGATKELMRENHYSANPGQVVVPAVMISVTLEVEHTRPLWSLTDEERTELRWWLPFNLALLCVRCHRAKTKAEAAQRAALRRGDVALAP